MFLPLSNTTRNRSMMTKTLLATALFAAAGFAQAQSATYAVDPTHTFV